jgi:hypothetical protein
MDRLTQLLIGVAIVGFVGLTNPCGDHPEVEALACLQISVNTALSVQATTTLEAAVAVIRRLVCDRNAERFRILHPNTLGMHRQ